MLGYTSTSLNFFNALQFSFDSLNSEQVPVVFQIVFRGSEGLFQLTTGFTAYPDEQEVLVQDGLTYLVTDNSEQLDPETNQTFRLIKLSYPAQRNQWAINQAVTPSKAPWGTFIQGLNLIIPSLFYKRALDFLEKILYIIIM